MNIAIAGKHGGCLGRLALCVMLLAACGTARAASQYGDIIIDVLPEGGGRSVHGYVENRFTVTNRSTKTAHAVTLALPGNSWGGSDLRRVERTVSVPPNTSAVVSLFQPAMNISGSGVGVSVNGRRYERILPIDVGNHGKFDGWRADRPLCVLVGRDLGKLVEAGCSRQIGSNRSGHEFQYDSPGLSPSDWSVNWLGYSRYDGVVVTAGEFRGMPAPVREAVTQYVECGGSLLVVGEMEAPESWGPSRALKRSLRAYNVGFGQCLVHDGSDVMKYSRADWRQINKSWLASADPWDSTWSIESANKAFPVVANLAVPVRGMYILMILFAVVIGPVNLVVLTKMRRRIWMLWTVPAVSLLTCLGVVGYSLLAEGITGHRRTETLTILDERSHRATSIGWTAFYCPLTPGGGLRFSYDSELTLQNGDSSSSSYSYRSRSSNSGGARLMDWTSEQHLTSGWVNARVPAHFKIRRSERRRERLTVAIGADGSVTVVNGLGAPITELHLAGADGRIHTGGRISPGAQASLTAPTSSNPRLASGDADVLRDAYGDRWTHGFSRLTKQPYRVLRPGTYIAVLEGAPFVQAGLDDAETHSCRTVVYGIMKGGSDGS